MKGKEILKAIKKDFNSKCPPPMTYNEYENYVLVIHADILKGIPEVFHPILSYMAYENKKMEGNEEIAKELRKLVSYLSDPITSFQERLREEYERAYILNIRRDT